MLLRISSSFYVFFAFLHRFTCFCTFLPRFACFTHLCNILRVFHDFAPFYMPFINVAYILPRFTYIHAYHVLGSLLGLYYTDF